MSEPRYTREYAKRGDVHNASPALVELGKKLLGYLVEQVALGAPPSIQIKRTIPEGTVIARLIHHHPEVIYFPRVTGASVRTSIPGGFVVSPTPTDTVPAHTWVDQGTNPEVLVLVKDNKTPATYKPGGFSKYKSWFPFGIRQAGNIDWRDAKEQWIISYYGPKNRYFEKDFDPTELSGWMRGGKTGFMPWVIRNGYTMLDVSSAAFLAVVPFVGAHAQIVGAGIRSGKLLFVVRDSVYTTEWVFSASLTNTDPTTAKVGAVYASAQLLAQRAMVAYENYGEASHPWLFNQAGTEARCIRYVADGNDIPTIYEGVLSTPKTDSAVFTMTPTTPPSSTRTDTYSATAALTYVTVWNLIVGGVPQTFTAVPPLAFGTNGSVAQTSSSIIALSATRHKIAVDYAANVPVYAYVTLPTFATATTGTSSFSYAQAAGTYDTTSSGASNYTVTGANASLHTDWFDLAAPTSSSTIYSNSGAVHLTGIVLSATALDSYTGGTYSRVESSVTTADDSHVSLTYLDLRYQIVVYELWRDQETQDNETNATFTLTGLYADTIADFYVQTTTISRTITATSVVQQGATILLTDSLSTPQATTTATLSKSIARAAFSTPVVGGGTVFTGNFDTFTGDGNVALSAPYTTVTPIPTPARLTDFFPDTPNSPLLNDGSRAIRIDQNGITRNGAWEVYRTQWAISMGLPNVSYAFPSPPPTTPDRWANGIKDSDLTTLCTGQSEKWVGGVNTGVNSPPFDLFFPISVVANTAVTRSVP